MATTDVTAVFDAAFIREFSKQAPENMASWFALMPIEVMGSGVIQRDRLLEIILAFLSNGAYEIDSKDGWDFSDYTDMKTVTVNYRASAAGKGQVLVTSINNKVGALRVVIYDPMSEEFRYVFIWDYETCRNYSRIEWTLNANSKYTNGTNGIEVSSIHELALIPASYRGR